MDNQQVSSDFDFRRVPLVIAGLALLALPFAYVQANLEILHSNPLFVLIFAVTALSSIGLIAYLAVFRHLDKELRGSPYLIFFAIFAFACVLDFLIAMTLMGYTDVMSVYFESGEPYLKSSHGMAVNFWDGTVHLGLYLWMSFCLASGRKHSSAALFWAGSMVGSCIVYMSGNLVGEYAEHIEPSYLLNLPFMIVPIFYAWKVASENSGEVHSERSNLSVVDYGLVVALLIVAALSAFRMLVVLNPEISLTHVWASEVEPYLLSSSRYPEIQMLVYGLYLMPFAILSVMAFWRVPSRAIAVWSWIFAGAVAQGQFGHIVASIASAVNDTPFAFDQAYSLSFWGGNLLVMFVPLLFAWRYQQRLRS